MDVFLSLGHFNMGVCEGLTQFWSQHQAAVWRRTDLVLLSVLAPSLSHGGYCLGHTDWISAAAASSVSLHKSLLFHNKSLKSSDLHMLLLLHWFKHFHIQIQLDADNYCGSCQFDEMLPVWIWLQQQVFFQVYLCPELCECVCCIWKLTVKWDMSMFLTCYHGI